MIDQQKLFEEIFSLADSVEKSELPLNACEDKLSDAGHKGEFRIISTKSRHTPFGEVFPIKVTGYDSRSGS